MEAKYLVMVDPVGNHNKFYSMTDTGDGKFRAEYGRVGAKGCVKIYPMHLWDTKYVEKIRKGYVDRTDLCVVTEVAGDKLSGIQDRMVQKLVSTLLNAAKKFVKKHYTYSTATPEAIAETRNLISRMQFSSSVYQLNDYLQQLFVTVPRRMSNVKEFLAEDITELDKIVGREASLIDALEGQVKTDMPAQPSGDPAARNILTANNLEIELCNKEESQELKKRLGHDSYKFCRAYKVKNKKTSGRYEKWCKENQITEKDKHLYFHGSRTVNWWNILLTGLDPAKANAGMFGYGVYFANRARKSIRYTGLRGAAAIYQESDHAFLAMFEVAYKKPMHINRWESSHSSLRLKDMVKRGTDAVFAHKGESLVNDEIIVYRKEQCTIRYLIEINN